ncbi:hypothetical protein [Ruegeria lacuscaerulensis]|nr:hypothetical protein [Ruegeria lacuscaerulensis]
MKFIALLLPVLFLAACDPSYTPHPEPEAQSSGSGISLSGYGRVGVGVRK